MASKGKGGKGKRKDNGKGRFQGDCNWCGKVGHKANECEEEICYSKERAWRRQPPHAASAISPAERCNIEAPREDEEPSIPKWMINVKKDEDGSAKSFIACGHFKCFESDKRHAEDYSSAKARTKASIDEFIVAKSRQPKRREAK